MIAHLDQNTFDGFYGENISSALLSLSDTLIDELLESEEILITVPMYNFGIPSTLKAYFDLVVRSGKTFRYEDEAIGLLRNKKAYIISAMGDLKNEVPTLIELHLKQILNYIGIREIFFFTIDGTADESTAIEKMQIQKSNITTM